MSGTGRVLGACTSAVGACAVTLPNTGSSAVTAVAVSLAAGLLTWGALYTYANR